MPALLANLRFILLAAVPLVGVGKALAALHRPVRSVTAWLFPRDAVLYVMEAPRNMAGIKRGATIASLRSRASVPAFADWPSAVDRLRMLEVSTG